MTKEIGVKSQVEMAIRRNAPVDFWSCKQDDIEKIKWAKGLTLAKVQKYWSFIRKYKVEEVFGDTYFGMLDNFQESFHKMLKAENILLFVIKFEDGKAFLVNTEGYQYARYTARVR